MQTNAESAERIMDAVGRVVRAIRRQLSGDVENGAFYVMGALVDGPQRLTALAASTHLDTSTVSRHLDTLVAKGFVERTPDPADGRAKLAGLTSEGRRAVKKIKLARRRLVTDELAAWDPADVAALEELLTRLSTNVAEKLR